MKDDQPPAPEVAARDRDDRDRFYIALAERFGPGPAELRSTVRRGELARIALKYGATVDEVDAFLAELVGVLARNRIGLYGAEVEALLDLRFNVRAARAAATAPDLGALLAELVAKPGGVG